MSTQIIHELQDLKYLEWSLIRASSGTAGSFLKATADFEKPKKYYKLSNYDTVNGIVGHECINEIIDTHELIVSIEEHNILGGLGSAIAEKKKRRIYVHLTISKRKARIRLHWMPITKLSVRKRKVH